MSIKYLNKTGLAHLWTKINEKFVKKESGKTLSSNDYTNADKVKLSGIEANANHYTLPPATVNALGGVKVGSGLRVAYDGTLSSPGGAAADFIVERGVDINGWEYQVWRSGKAEAWRNVTFDYVSFTQDADTSIWRSEDSADTEINMPAERFGEPVISAISDGGVLTEYAIDSDKIKFTYDSLTQTTRSITTSVYLIKYAASTAKWGELEAANVKWGMLKNNIWGFVSKPEE